MLPSGETRWLFDYRDGTGKRRAKHFRTKSEAISFETVVRAQIAAGTIWSGPLTIHRM